MTKAVIFDMYETLITHYATPLYFSKEMASTLQIDLNLFLSYWGPTNDLRSTGKLSFEQIIDRIVQEQHIDPSLKEQVIQKRIETKKDLFHHLHPEIIPLLKVLKEKGIKLAIISNCFSEEADIIEASFIASYFDTIVLSYRVGCMKPDSAIYTYCLNQLGLKAEECIYLGDGGSNELDGASNMHMQALQACYYQHTLNPNYPSIKHPLALLDYIQ